MATLILVVVYIDNKEIENENWENVFLNKEAKKKRNFCILVKKFD